MQFGILHLSDIHLKHEEKNSILDKLDSIVLPLKIKLRSISHLFLLVSGDSAYSGRAEEYTIAESLLNQIVTRIHQMNDALPVNVIVAPGNHDCFFQDDDNIRPLVLTDIQNSLIIKPDYKTVVLQPQIHYREFERKYSSDYIIASNEFIKVYAFPLSDQLNLHFAVMNSAWMSSKHEKPGSLLFPTDSLNLIPANPLSFTVAVMHHPWNWLIPQNLREVRELLIQKVNLLLTGHEHEQASSELRSDVAPTGLEIIEGGVLQDSYNQENSTFNFICVNIPNKQRQLFIYRWVGTHYEETEIGSKTIQNYRKYIILRPLWEKFLQNPDFTIRHPRCKNVSLPDIFVYPQARVLNVSDGPEDKPKRIDLEALTELRKGGRKQLLIGRKKSGKTALCKMLYRHYYEQGLIPVYIRADTSNKAIFKNFEKVLEKSIAEQYQDLTLSEFIQYDDELKVLIIEDVDKYAMNNQSLQKFLEEIRKYSNNILITGQEITLYSDYLDSDYEEGGIDEYEVYEILPFGYRKRYDFIERWHSLGAEDTIDKKELVDRCHETETLVNNILRNNLVPSNPVTMLMLLQLEHGLTPQVTRESSYGYYYEMLITQSLMEINLPRSELDSYYTFTSELAFYMFTEHKRSLTIEELQQFYDIYETKYRLGPYSNQRIENLTKSTILEQKGDTYQFRHSYLEYYFLAKYLADHISNPSVREIISNLCKQIHLDENADILMFLIHATKDNFVLEEIYSHAIEIFRNVPLTTLNPNDNSVGWNEVIRLVPEIVYYNTDVQHYRKELLNKKDELEQYYQEKTKQLEVAAAKTEQGIDSELDIVALIISAFKYVEILGLIVRNYYGSIEGHQKLILLSEAFSLGMRTLTAFTNSIFHNLDTLIKKSEQFLKKSNLTNKHEILEKIRRFLSTLPFYISYGCIQHVASSVGAPTLFPIYEEILKEYQHTSFKLIELSIQLAHRRHLPLREIEHLKQEFKGNVVADKLLKYLVVDHLNMFVTSFEEKQKLQDILGISIQRQRQLELMAKNQRKRPQ
jgi:GTPase SAR1 family protein